MSPPHPIKERVMTANFDLTLTEAGMMQAIEHWLNATVLVVPCKVTGMKEEKDRMSNSLTWKVKIEEQTEPGSVKSLESHDQEN